MKSIKQFIGIAILAIVVSACSNKTSSVAQDAAVPFSTLTTNLETVSSSSGNVFVSDTLSDAEVLRIVIDTTLTQIEHLKVQLAEAKLNSRNMNEEQLKEYISKIESAIAEREAYLEKLKTDSATQQQAIDNYRLSELNAQISADYASMSCDRIAQIIAESNYSSDFERQIAMQYDSRCKEQALQVLQTQWNEKYGGLTCEQKEVVLNDPNTKFESDAEKSHLASLVNYCEYSAAFATYSVKTCTELQVIIKADSFSSSIEKQAALDAANMVCQIQRK